LPRSLRPLAQALTVSAENAQSGLDAALSDIDCPLIALACSDIAAGALDFASAERAAQAALEMRSELAAASERIVRLRLRRGDLAHASEAAKTSGDTGSLALVASIDAYEQRRADLLKQAIEDAGTARGWALGPIAQRQLDGTAKPSLEELKPSLDAGEPWADVLAIDIAIEAGKLDEAKKIAGGWADASPARDKRKKLLDERAKNAP
jgi:predicted Zn-dependent protease